MQPGQVAFQQIIAGAGIPLFQGCRIRANVRLIHIKETISMSLNLESDSNRKQVNINEDAQRVFSADSIIIVC